MNTSINYQCKLKFERRGRGARLSARVANDQDESELPKGRVPRVARLMALAIRFEDLIRRGEVRDYAELARLAHVTRARITQIMNLRLLAPDIQEAILFLPRFERGRDRIGLAQIQPIALTVDWRKQRQLWRQLSSSSLSLPQVLVNGAQTS
ncbi:hypothetical protein [Bremerella sp. P1]|uniref:hypothetical protein n=1 Tax=Bremerella sp. P1 TaxID=3026424 RepID=UPI002367B282|nr:hypothetical protein [Bremerella sp. P1]WDI40475.1 hypothetical protein PSR63_18525 [Bremerella sp. P1]